MSLCSANHEHAVDPFRWANDLSDNAGAMLMHLHSRPVAD